MFNISKKKIIFFIVFTVFIGCLLFYWKYSYTMHKKNLTFLQYEEIIDKIKIKNSKNFGEAEKFILTNNNIYGTLTSLSLAKKYVLCKDLDKALTQLNNSLKYTEEENLKNILKLNIAKIEIQKNEEKKAIDILDTIKNHNWENIVENIKGDVFINQKNEKLALKSWKKSLSIEESNTYKDIINMKINELNNVK